MSPEALRQALYILKKLTTMRIPPYELPADGNLVEAIYEIEDIIKNDLFAIESREYLLKERKELYKSRNHLRTALQFIMDNSKHGSLCHMAAENALLEDEY